MPDAVKSEAVGFARIAAIDQEALFDEAKRSRPASVGPRPRRLCALVETSASLDGSMLLFG